MAASPAVATDKLVFVLLGPPGSGKGTQGEKLSAELGIPKVATGDVLRAAVAAGTPLGREAQGYMDRGALVPDEVILGIMKEALAGPAAAKGAILDGVVRTIPQAEGLEKVLTAIGKQLGAVLVFEIPDEQLVKRISSRVVCEGCQTPSTGTVDDAAFRAVCAKCGGKLVRRADDEPDAVRNRLAVYKKQTAPVIDWYEDRGANMVHVDAVGTPEQVRKRILRALAR
jgi:adenylate kinase